MKPTAPSPAQSEAEVLKKFHLWIAAFQESAHRCREAAKGTAWEAYWNGYMGATAAILRELADRTGK